MISTGIVSLHNGSRYLIKIKRPPAGGCSSAWYQNRIGEEFEATWDGSRYAKRFKVKSPEGKEMYVQKNDCTVLKKLS